MIRQAVKAVSPEFLVRAYRGIYWRIRRRLQQRKETPLAIELQARIAQASQLAVDISPQAVSARSKVETAAIKVYGADYNYYSDALRREIVQGFETTLNAVSSDLGSIDYLEIGSCRGLSMGLIGSMLVGAGRLGSLVSIDPYFESGFIEGKDGPYGENIQVNIDKNTKAQAQALYEDLQIQVELIEQTSLSGLRKLVEMGRKFDLIYIDGAHERLWPTVDFGLSCAVLRQGGVIILDDHLWPDVNPLKLLCDKHLEQIQETWKTASYRVKF